MIAAARIRETRLKNIDFSRNETYIETARLDEMRQLRAGEARTPQPVKNKLFSGPYCRIY